MIEWMHALVELNTDCAAVALRIGFLWPAVSIVKTQLSQIMHYDN